MFNIQGLFLNVLIKNNVMYYFPRLQNKQLGHYFLESYIMELEDLKFLTNTFF